MSNIVRNLEETKDASNSLLLNNLLGDIYWIEWETLNLEVFHLVRVLSEKNMHTAMTFKPN